MRVLVTRPEPDALKLKGLLEARGHEASVEPLMRTAFLPFDPDGLDGVTTIIATSRNGLKGLKAQGAHRIAAQLPIYVVGRATAREAQALGFTEIIVGGGTVASLVPEIVATADPQNDVLAPEECPLVNVRPETVETVIESLIRDRARLHELGVQGRRYIERHYALEAFAARLRTAMG